MILGVNNMKVEIEADAVLEKRDIKMSSKGTSAYIYLPKEFAGRIATVCILAKDEVKKNGKN